MESTTSLEIIRHSPRRFTWGRVIAIHDVGRYTIVEFEPTPTEGRVIDVKPKTSYYVYVDGKDRRASTHSIEGAMLLAISRANFSDPGTGDLMVQAAAKLLDVRS